MLCAAMPAFAGRPLATEDARVLGDKECQVETWVNRSREATTAWLVPSCNFGANIQWQVGGSRTREAGQSTFSEAFVQAKTVFPGADDAPWRAGLVLGVVRRPQEPQGNGWDNPYALVPLTFSPPDTSTSLHANLGWRHDRDGNRNVTLWGLAAETEAAEGWTLLGEAFGENGERPFMRLGLRYTAIKDRLDVDLSAVTRPGGTREERFLSLGLTWQVGRILP